MNVIDGILFVFLLYAVYTDVTQTRISNRLIVSGMAAAFCFRAVTEGRIGILIFFIHSFLPVILLYLLFQMRVLGAGDIKLFSMIGAFLSIEQLLKLIVLAFCIGAFFGICKISYQIFFGKYELGTLTQIHFSPAIFIAYLLVWGGGFY